MKKLLLIFIILFGFTACSEKEEMDAQSIFQLNSTWENQFGNKFKLHELKGKTLVMVMIYTNCKTACPRLTAEMRDIERNIGEIQKNRRKIKRIHASGRCLQYVSGHVCDASGL